MLSALVSVAHIAAALLGPLSASASFDTPSFGFQSLRPGTPQAIEGARWGQSAAIDLKK
jgi:hypothetical protein